MSLRLSHGPAYRADLATLRRLARDRGDNAMRSGPLDLPVEIPNAPHGYTLSLTVDLACAPDDSPPASPDLLGFANRHGAFRFRRDPPMWTPVLPAIDLGIDGSYRALGYADAPLPGISSANLIGSAILLSRFTGPVPVKPGIVADALARLSVAVCEALCVDATANAVAAALDNGIGYDPNVLRHRRRFDSWTVSPRPLAR